tara:strand:- start:2500 stop:2703 length:204 start_codon:yes stop_codon:yes gene_type:complete
MSHDVQPGEHAGANSEAKRALEAPDVEIPSNQAPPPGAAEAAMEDARDHPTSSIARTLNDQQAVEEQ